MTSQEKDKFICEKLGLCWHHEGATFVTSKTKSFYCKKCKAEIIFRIQHPEESWPDFTSEAGRVQLLKLIVKKYGWVKLVQHYENAVTLLVDIADDTGRFRDEVFRWLEVRNE